MTIEIQSRVSSNCSWRLELNCTIKMCGSATVCDKLICLRRFFFRLLEKTCYWYNYRKLQPNSLLLNANKLIRSLLVLEFWFFCSYTWTGINLRYTWVHFLKLKFFRQLKRSCGQYPRSWWCWFRFLPRLWQIIEQDMLTLFGQFYHGTLKLEKRIHHTGYCWEKKENDSTPSNFRYIWLLNCSVKLIT